MKKVIPPVCHICGSTENIEYHHILPLKFGGDNRLNNIIALCSRCHKGVHLGRHIHKYKNTEHMGRPKKAELTPEVEEIMWDWANGLIGSAECLDALGFKKSVHIKETSTYKDFIAKNGIENVRNTLDVVRTNGKPRTDSKVSIIAYADSNVVVNYYGDIGDD